MKRNSRAKRVFTASAESALCVPHELRKVAAKLYRCFPQSPIATQALKMLEAGDGDGLVQLKVDPRTYRDPEAYFIDAQCASFLRKFEGIVTTIDKRQAAVDKWWLAEKQCKRTNLRLEWLLNDDDFGYAGMHPEPESKERISEFFRDVRKTIRSWIGLGPSLSRLRASCKFGPGTTFELQSQKATLPDKMAFVPTMTKTTPMWVPASLLAGTAWFNCQEVFGPEIQTTRGNRFTTVPKDGTTDRGIAIEAGLNVYVQLGIGNCLRDELRQRTGWDLNDAADIHRSVAQQASRSREFATLDLQSASDTVAKTLVRALLPHRWLTLMEAVRSTYTFLDGKWVELEKFSSMGNGYTFELETIIFAALSHVMSVKHGYDGGLGRDIFTFGDDIIVRETVVKDLVAVLQYCGFSLNENKSFWGDIPFRESCGADFFNGTDVRPYFQKGNLYGPRNLVALANGLFKVRKRLALLGLASCDASHRAVLDLLPKEVRVLRGPVDLGDIVIHDDDPETWRVRIRDGIRQLKVISAPRPRKVAWAHFHPEVVYACALYGSKQDHPKGWSWAKDGGVTPRSLRSSDPGYRISWSCYS